MDTLIETFNTITRQAAGANRTKLDNFSQIIDKLRDVALCSFRIGAMTDAHFERIGGADAEATQAMKEGREAFEREQLALIAELSDDQEMKAWLRPMLTGRDALYKVEVCMGDVTFLVREHGSFVDLFIDGMKKAELDAYDITLDKDDLVIENVGRWSLEEIGSAGKIEDDEEDKYGFLLKDGTLIEIKQRETR